MSEREEERDRETEKERGREREKESYRERDTHTQTDRQLKERKVDRLEGLHPAADGHSLVEYFIKRISIYPIYDQNL